jgi:hypothetical protein
MHLWVACRRLLLLMLAFSLSGSSFCQELFITEVKPLNDTTSAQVNDWPWIELRNLSTDSVLLSDYTLSFDSIVFFPLPIQQLGPKKYVLIYCDTSGVIHDAPTINYSIKNTKTIYLIGNASVSKLLIPDGISSVESYGRYPENSQDWIFFPEEFISPGSTNLFPGAWQKVAAKASFSPRDSTPNGILVYDGNVFLFEGYKKMEDGTYYSTSDVHVSSDGVNWKLINPDPPFNPYSAYIAFNGWMWAFEHRAYRSKDGIEWEDAGPTPLGRGGRITLLNSRLYWTSGSEIYASDDGLSWQLLLEDCPWEARVWPALQTMNGKLWLFGGAGNPNTTTPYYYNDVWSSSDGINWELEIEHAAFPGRYWFGSHVFDNKLWVLGGYSYYDDILGAPFEGNRKDVWYSEDGIHWFEMAQTFTERHAPLSWVKGDNLFISSGLNGYFLLNDIWRFEKRQFPQDELIARFDSVIYGDTVQLAIEAEIDSDVFAFTSDNPAIATVSGKNIITNKVGSTMLHFHIEPDLFNHGADLDIPFTVLKKQLLVKAVDAVKEFGDPLPEFAVNYSGFIRDDDPGSLTEAPMVLTDASQFSSIGEYVIELTGGQAANYSFRYVPGQLEIKGKNELVAFPNPSSSTVNIIYTNQEIHIRDVSLYDSQGSVVVYSSVNDDRGVLDVSSLPAGLYTLVTSFLTPIRPVVTKIVVTDR